MWTDLLPLMTYCFVMSSTPGPNNVMLATSGAMFGYRRALPQIFGTNSGVAVQTFVTCLGLGSLFVAFPVLHQILRVTGALYLVFLAWKLSASSLGEARETKPLTFAQAALFQAVNPKSWVKAITLASVFMPVGLSAPVGALLVAVVLSAQCTDKKVNEVTPALFALASTPEQMMALGPDRILELIRQIGLAPTKARNLWLAAEKIVESGGEVIPDWEFLESLAGVGHKTASVVMSQGFGIPAFAVDTHIHRLAWRWGLSSGRSVERTTAATWRSASSPVWCPKVSFSVLKLSRSKKIRAKAIISQGNIPSWKSRAVMRWKPHAAT